MLLYQNRLILIWIVSTLAIVNAKGQSINEDLILLKNHQQELLTDHSGHNHQISFLLSDHPSVFVRYNPISLALGSMMWVYQRIISPQFSSTCLYSPSCSSFSKELITDYGILFGVILTTERLSRCNRLALYDFKSWEADRASGKITERTSYYRLHD